MQCIRCKYPDTKVYDTRISANGKSVKRRRECLDCSYRFTTVEEVKVLDLKVQKRNGQKVDFDAEKLRIGIKKAYNKRTIDNHKISQLLEKVVEDIMSTGRNPIKSTRIGKIVLKNLRDSDEAAYLTFGAMFWNFETLEDFNKLMQEFQKED